MTDTKIILQHLEKIHDTLDAAHQKQLNRCRRFGWLAYRENRTPVELAVENGMAPTPEEEFAMHEGWERCRKSFEADEMPDEWKDLTNDQRT